MARIVRIVQEFVLEDSELTTLLGALVSEDWDIIRDFCETHSIPYHGMLKELKAIFGGF